MASEAETAAEPTAAAGTEPAAGTWSGSCSGSCSDTATVSPFRRSVTLTMPKVSRSRASSAGTAWSPRSTLPATADRVSASAVARAARLASRVARSTMLATMIATTANTHSASTLLGSEMVNRWTGGMK